MSGGVDGDGLPCRTGTEAKRQDGGSQAQRGALVQVGLGHSAFPVVCRSRIWRTVLSGFLNSEIEVRFLWPVS